MKKLLVLSMALISSLTFAQFQDGLSVKKSARKTESSTFGLGKIEVNYGSPKKKGRKLFGELVPYGKIWRVGADNATSIEMNTSFYVGGNRVDAGKYALFLIPEESGDWKLMLNKNADQWGAYAYDKELNVLETTVKVGSVKEEVEALDIRFHELADGKGTLEIVWGTTQINVPMSVKLTEQFDDKFAAIMKATPEGDKWAAYAQSADFLLNQNYKLNEALEYAMTSVSMMEALSDEAKAKLGYYKGYVNFTLARAYAANGDKENAKKMIAKVQADNGDGSYYSYERNTPVVDALLKEVK
ncbi:Protein of unknown function [Lishizhenia tianjinensis]|uniref:DUF2911 domain-containing protein n=1 Tax=Lishizhenia tianjinensis TaxID=477690 RepID=A0A1I6YQI0_9FLAO|nr:DUF2911 domain-containing protein [Lishizhenia tianjinensis]SFT52680.1 Protein of unknown function [Lishizhenia tianjinensis]